MIWKKRKILLSNLHQKEFQHNRYDFNADNWLANDFIKFLSILLTFLIKKQAETTDFEDIDSMF